MNVHEKVTELRREIREMHEKMLEKQAEQLTMREIGFGQRFRSWQDHSEELNSGPASRAAVVFWVWSVEWARACVCDFVAFEVKVPTLD